MPRAKEGGPHGELDGKVLRKFGSHLRGRCAPKSEPLGTVSCERMRPLRAGSTQSRVAVMVMHESVCFFRSLRVQPHAHGAQQYAQGARRYAQSAQLYPKLVRQYSQYAQHYVQCARQCAQLARAAGWPSW
jgi:hypothetical protein